MKREAIQNANKVKTKQGVIGEKDESSFSGMDGVRVGVRVGVGVVVGVVVGNAKHETKLINKERKERE